MSTFFQTLLISHVIFGIVGLIASFVTSYLLLKKDLPRAVLVKTSFIAFFSYIISWFTGGWYYWKYYRTTVKPIIMSGNYPWAHAVFMETKEHIFLFLPFATLVLAIIIYFKTDTLRSNPDFRNRVLLLSLTITSLAVIITLSGILISGGAQ